MAEPAEPASTPPSLGYGALTLGLAGAALAPVTPFAAIALGAASIALGLVAFRGAGGDRSRRGVAVGGAVLGVFAVLLGAVVAVAGPDEDDDAPALVYLDGIATATPDDDDPPQDDVASPLACRVEIGVVRAGSTVTNRTPTPVRYTIAVAWEQRGATIATTSAVIEPVTPGQTRSFEVVAPGEGTSGTTCRATRVDRTAL